MSHPVVEHCSTMADVRRNIDALDERIEFIVDRVCAQARAAGAPEAILEATYRAMIAASIDFERRQFTSLRQEAES